MTSNERASASVALVALALGVLNLCIVAFFLFAYIPERSRLDRNLADAISRQAAAQEDFNRILRINIPWQGGGRNYDGSAARP